MPERPLTIATYAAGASLAAVTLVYVFGPTWTLDQDSPNASNKRGVVGLANPANDCFINSVLQVLAGLPDLRIYLIREVHRRKLDGAQIYALTAEDEAEFERSKRMDLRPWKVEGLRRGIVTVALKQMLDALNERPIYKKTTTAGDFIFALEKAFRTRISRQQQDAQEFLQIVAERLCDEYHAGAKARRRARDQLHKPLAGDEAAAAAAVGAPVGEDVDQVAEKAGELATEDAEEEGFPLEGRMESQVECLTCHFRPKPSVSTFVTLTLNVPQKSSTTLNSCFDGVFKVEHIDDYKCDYCRLQHAIWYKERQLGSATPTQRAQLEIDIRKLRTALEEDPEEPPKDVTLPDSKLAPSRRIEKHSRISSFPKVLAVHLSRSLYSASSLSTKNTAKVSFPESLPLGGILEQHHYRLLGVVTHKGGHNSGHYESFRRQVVPEPYSTPHSFGHDGPYSQRGSPNPSAVQSPRVSARTSRDSRPPRLSHHHADLDRSQAATPSSATISLSDSPSSLSSQSSLSLASPRKPAAQPPTSAPRQDLVAELPPSASPTPSPSPPTPGAPPALKPPSPVKKTVAAMRKTRRRDNRWWRISDDKIKESRTSEVLGMQKEVYLLFYELVRRKGDDE